MACLFKPLRAPSYKVSLSDFYTHFPSVLHLLAQADIWHSKAILLFILLNNWNSSFFFSLKLHEKSFFPSLSWRQIWLSKLWKCQHCGLSVCTPGGRRGSRFMHRPVSFSLKCISSAMKAYGRGHVTDGWTFSGTSASGEWQTDAVYLHLNASLLFVSPAFLPLPRPIPPLLFPSSHHLNYMCLKFVIPPFPPALLLCRWPPMCSPA